MRERELKLDAGSGGDDGGTSLPMRERELKLYPQNYIHNARHVAPHAGARIETYDHPRTPR